MSQFADLRAASNLQALPAATTNCIDSLSPTFAEDLETVIKGVEHYVSASVTTEGTRHAVRFAHAKAYGFVKGELEILDGLPTEYAQGIYAPPGKHAGQTGPESLLPRLSDG